MRIRVLFLFLLLSVTAAAQKTTVQYTMTKEQMEAKRKEIMDDIKETEAQLEATRSKKGATLGELRILQNQLAVRQRLIESIDDKLDYTEHTIQSSSKEVLTLRQKLEQLKIRYAQSIRYAYETRSSYDMIAFLFSSSDFNDAMRRMKYLKKFRDFRKDQVEQIRMTQAQLQHKIGVLNATKEELESTQKDKIEQTQKLKEETDQKNQVVQGLKGQENQLLKDIEINRKKTASINKAIQRYIEIEIEKAAKKAAEEEEKRRIAEAKNGAANPKAPGTNTNNGGNNNGGSSYTDNSSSRTPGKVRAPMAGAPGLLLTPTDVTLANNFEGNKGRLYWPVEKGYIIDHFGPHPHPVEHQVMIDNNGVDIQTDPNASVRAVFEGVVSRVFSLDGNSQSVMIVHGNFFTVYNGLESASVKEGQHVEAKQAIGRVGLNDENIPAINFQIWKSTGKKASVKMNPEVWMGRAH